MQKVSRAMFLKYAQYNDELLRLEIEVLQCAADNRHNSDFCAINAWYGTFKRKMCKLVGWGVADDRLKTSKAYDTVYQYLYHLLPDCAHEGMCRIVRYSAQV